MEAKDLIAIIGIGLTFLVSAANFLYSWQNNKRTSFVNTVTTSRLKWIDSLRDNVSEFIAVTNRLVSPPSEKDVGTLMLQRDTLLHQIILHLNPDDPQDRSIKKLVDRVRNLTDEGTIPKELPEVLIELRDATGAYLKK